MSSAKSTPPAYVRPPLLLRVPSFYMTFHVGVSHNIYRIILDEEEEDEVEEEREREKRNLYLSRLPLFLSLPLFSFTSLLNSHV